MCKASPARAGRAGVRCIEPAGRLDPGALIADAGIYGDGWVRPEAAVHMNDRSSLDIWVWVGEIRGNLDHYSSRLTPVGSASQTLCAREHFIYNIS